MEVNGDGLVVEELAQFFWVFLALLQSFNILS